MYRKVMVMEVKEHYALAMGEDGQIVRIRYKDGMKIGDCIYILEEDLYQKEKIEYPEHPALVPFETKKEKAKKPHPFWKQITAVAAAAALFIALFTWAMKPGTAYAMVTVDGDKNVEMTLDKKHVVKGALSRDNSYTEKEIKTLVGQKVDAAENYVEARKGTAVIGYTLCRTASEEETEALHRYLERIFGTEGVIYVCGSKEDIQKAEKSGKSLGIYLTEQAVSEDNLDSIQNRLPEEKIWELLKKQPVLMQEDEIKEYIDNAWSRYQETVFEEEDDTDESDSEAEEEIEIEEDEPEMEVPEKEEAESPFTTNPEVEKPDAETEEFEEADDWEEPEQQDVDDIEVEESEIED